MLQWYNAFSTLYVHISVYNICHRVTFASIIIGVTVPDKLDDATCIEAFSAVMRAFAKKDLIVLTLIDFSNLCSSSDISLLMRIKTCCTFDHSVVISMSSGQGIYSQALPKEIQKFAMNMRALRSVELRPFDDDEANVFIDSVPGFRERIQNQEELKILTGYNPLLLSICSSLEASDWQDKVELYVESYAQSLLEVLSDDALALLIGNLHNSLYCLYCAYNEILQPNSVFKNTWIYREYIVYIVSRTEEGQTLLAVNFPTIYPHLMIALKQKKGRLGDVSTPIIDGYYFEQMFCERVEKFQVCYANQNDQNPIVRTLKININKSVETAVSNLCVGVLYHLRPMHPVIDAVGVLQDESGSHHLAMIQVSLSPYEKHNSKAGDLLNVVTGLESHCSKSKCTWLAYYTELAEKVIAPPSGSGGTPPPTTPSTGSGGTLPPTAPPSGSSDTCPPTVSELKRLYIYVSPKNIYRIDVNTGESPCSILADNSVRSRTKDFYLGLVVSNSPTADLVTNITSEL